MASLSVEACDDDAEQGARGGEEERGFLVAAFDIPANELPEFFRREEEFFIVTAPIHELDGAVRARGLLCLASTDDEYKARHGEAAFLERYARFGMPKEPYLYHNRARVGSECRPSAAPRNPIADALRCRLELDLELARTHPALPRLPPALRAGCAQGGGGGLRRLC